MEHSRPTGSERRFHGRWRKVGRKSHSWPLLLRSRAFLGACVALVALAMLVAHGVPGWNFQVDVVSLGLLGFVSLPFLSLIVTSFKAGNVEFSFRDLSVHDQVMTFLDGIAIKRQWTFFAPRSGENEPGTAFVELTGELVSRARSELLGQLRTWLKSEDLNQRWFAAEIIGYHQLSELRRAVSSAPETIDPSEPWDSWELNCLWAASRLEEPPYQRLGALLAKTSVRSNQLWILKSFDQMIESRLADAAAFLGPVSDFVARLRASQATEAYIAGLFENLACLRIPPPVPSASGGEESAG